MNSKVKAEVFKMRFLDAHELHNQGKLSCEDAAELLGISISTFYRKRQIFKEEGCDGVLDRRIGKVSPHRAADAEVEYVTKLFSNKYKAFSVKHFYEFAKREHGVTRSYGWTKNKLIEAGLVLKSNRGGKHRLRRERKAMAGMMLHQDGSKHRWLQNLDYDLDLIVTMDDATSKITSCFLIEEEGTISSFLGIYETIKTYGLFCSLYTDRGSHYFYTSEAGGKVDKSRLTQVGRALKRLGIKHIAAYSPEARGRSERMFGTLQNRLPQEFALKGIKTIEEANRYIKEVYLPRHNEQFCVQPASEETAFAKWTNAISLEDILCIEEERVVQKDNTVRYNGLILQIPENDHRQQYIKAEVKVHEYCDHDLAIFYGHLCIGRYDAQGKLISERAGRHTGLIEAKVGVQPSLASIGEVNYNNNIVNNFLYGNKIGQLTC
jgi:transposase